MRARALKLAADGFLVFPVVARGQKPVFEGWQERATSDPDKVRIMWTSSETGEAENFNIGIRTGVPLPSGDTLFVVDLDTTPEIKAGVRYDALRAAVPDVPATVSARTPGKGGNRGVHLFFYCSAGEEVHNSVKKLVDVPGVDVRGKGGYVVGPGSIRDDGEYSWEPSASLAHIAIAPATPALLALCKARAPCAEGEGGSPPPCGELDTPRMIEDARQWLLNEAPEAKEGEGGRGVTINVIQKLGDLGLSPEGTFQLLTEEGGWNDTKADPPWPIDADDSDGFRRLINDLFKNNRKSPAGSGAVENVFEPVEIANGSDAPAQTPERPASAQTMAAWLKRDIPPLDPLLGDVFFTTSRWLIYAGTGTGKTLFTLEMAAAMAAGKRFLDWEPRRGARVLYLDGEMPEAQMRQRLAMAAGLYGDDLPFYLYNRDSLDDGEMPPLDTKPGADWLWRKVEETKPDVVIFDNIQCLLRGNMKEAEWRPAGDLAKKLTKRRIGVIWVHHTGHNGEHSYGDKSREWDLSAVVALRREGQGKDLRMTFEKKRDETPETEQQFRERIINRTPDGWLFVGEARGASAKRPPSESAKLKGRFLDGYNALAKSKQSKVSAADITDWLKTEGLIALDDGRAVPGKVRLQIHRAKVALIDDGVLRERDGLIRRVTQS